jgi:threonine/homoserine/homoserine lactone efflux protein
MDHNYMRRTYATARRFDCLFLFCLGGVVVELLIAYLCALKSNWLAMVFVWGCTAYLLWIALDSLRQRDDVLNNFQEIFRRDVELNTEIRLIHERSRHRGNQLH